MPGEKPRFVRGQCCVHATENSGLEERAPHFPQKVFTKKLNSGVNSGHVTVGTPAFRRAFIKQRFRSTPCG
jgi:hypothetical protein